MSNSFASVTKKGVDTRSILDRLRRVKDMEVLVGIPAEKVQRKGDEINNASLAFIMTNGSPLNHIPPRPFLEPGIKKAGQLIAKKLASASKALIAGNPEQANKFLNQAGQAGVNSVKRYILEGTNVVPNAPSTIKSKGSSKPLIDSAKMLKSITYVVKEAGVEKENQTTVKEKYSGYEKSTSTEVSSGVAETAEIAEVL